MPIIPVAVAAMLKVLLPRLLPLVPTIIQGAEDLFGRNKGNEKKQAAVEKVIEVAEKEGIMPGGALGADIAAAIVQGVFDLMKREQILVEKDKPLPTGVEDAAALEVAESLMKARCDGGRVQHVHVHHSPDRELMQWLNRWQQAPPADSAGHAAIIKKLDELKAEVAKIAASKLTEAEYQEVKTKLDQLAASTGAAATKLEEVAKGTS